jgi:type II secretory pathway pseudopilin PulG
MRRRAIPRVELGRVLTVVRKIRRPARPDKAESSAASFDCRNPELDITNMTASMIHPRSRRLPAVSRVCRRGFTLMEASLVTVVIGVGVVAMLQLLAAGTLANGYSNEQTTAVNLANNVHEISLGLPFYDPDTLPKATPAWSTPENASNTAFDDILDLDGKTFNPPIDVNRNSIANADAWTQQVSVKSVGGDQMSSVRPNTVAEPTALVTVTILHNNKAVYQMSWVAVAPAP